MPELKTAWRTRQRNDAEKAQQLQATTTVKLALVADRKAVQLSTPPPSGQAANDKGQLSLVDRSLVSACYPEAEWKGSRTRRLGAAGTSWVGVCLSVPPHDQPRMHTTLRAFLSSRPSPPRTIVWSRQLPSFSSHQFPGVITNTKPNSIGQLCRINHNLRWRRVNWLRNSVVIGLAVS